MSFNSVAGFTSNSTMKPEVELNAPKIVVIVDLGVMHNFYCKNLILELQLLWREMRQYDI